MKTSRRGFLKALGMGAVGVGVATTLPMGLLGVTETKHERLSQHILKARILSREGLRDLAHVEMNEAFRIINEEFVAGDFEDTLFAVATAKYALRDCQVYFDHQATSEFKGFHRGYGKFILNDGASNDPVYIGVSNMLRSARNADVENSTSAYNVLQGYYPELKGKRNIV